MINRIISKIGGGDISSSAIQAIILSGSLSIFLKFFGLIKEAVIANYFGVSGQLDIYILAMLSLLFFVSPVAGTIGTLLTQKYIETKQKSTIIAALVYRQSLLVAGLLITFFLFLFFTIHQISFLHSVLPARFEDIRLREFLIMAPIAIFSVISVVNGAVFTAEKRFVTFSSLPTVVPISIIVCLLLDLAGDLFYSLLLGTLIGYTIEMAGGIVLLARLWSKFFENMCETANQKFVEMKSGFFPLFSASLIMGGCVVVDQFMAVLAGEGAVSIVNFGSRLPLGLISVVGITWIVLYPIFSELVAEGERYQLRQIYLRFVGLCLVVLLPLCMAISFFSSELIALFFQRGVFAAEDTNIVSQLQILYLLYIPFYTICIFSIRVANSHQSQKIVLIGNSLTLGVNIIMNLVFIKFYGVLGIAVATLISYCLMSVFWFAVVNIKFFSFSKVPASEIKNRNNVSLKIETPSLLSEISQFFRTKVSLKRISQFLITRLVINVRNLRESYWAIQDSKFINTTDNVLFVDLGANLGQAYRWFRQYYHHQNVTFELFEPNPNCCRKLREIPEIASGKVPLFEMAASTYTGSTPFYGISYPEDDIFSVGGSIIKHQRAASFNAKDETTLYVKVIDFCEYLQAKSSAYNKIIVKMDIEGAELSLLEKLISTKSIQKIDVLYVEFHSKFLKSEEAESSYNRERNIIKTLSKIPDIRFRIWH